MTHLTKEERRLYAEFFLDNDVDGNGYLTTQEFINSDISKLGFTKDDHGKMIQVTFGNLDQNKDGKITLDEYFLICEKLPPEVRQQAELRRMYQLMDVDADGKVTEQEFFNYMRAKKTILSNAYIRHIFKTADKNKDGRLTYRELMESSMGPAKPSGHP